MPRVIELCPSRFLSVHALDLCRAQYRVLCCSYRMKFQPTLLALPLLLAGCLVQAQAQAQAPSAAIELESAPAQLWDIKGQSTYVGQHKYAVKAPYAGRNSLLAEAETSYSFSATAYLGLRLPVLGELYFNSEVIQGRPLSGLLGLGSFSNGEMQKVAGSNPKAYVPRLFLRRDWALGEETQMLDAAPNQLAGPQATHRLRLTMGKFAITDVFDANAYSHDPRTQFLAWASLAHGSYDFAADAKGYTQGAALEYSVGYWTLRAGRFMVPIESNGEVLSTALRDWHGDQFEIEHQHEWNGLKGATRLLLWRNRERMGAFQEAMAQAGSQTPAIEGVRRTQTKSGWGLHVEQALNASLGMFARISQGDGHTENYSFEEVDGSRQLGLSLKGAAWSRERDTLGLLWMNNSLSPSHRRYLALGGMGFFIGDGRLNYGEENTLEAYYSFAVGQAFSFSLDLQRISNPAYNRDRGPVSLVSMRAHAEF